MTLIITIAAFLLSCVVLAYFLGAALEYIWRPMLAIAIGAFVFWFVVTLIQSASYQTNQTIAWWYVNAGAPTLWLVVAGIVIREWRKRRAFH